MITKLTDESYLSYIRRATQALKNKDISHKQWGDCILGDLNVYSKDNCRKGYYIVAPMIEKLEKDFLENYSKNSNTENLLEELETLKDEIYKETVKKQDANREKRGLLREEARFENLVEVLRDEIYRLNELPKKNFKVQKTKDKTFGILCLTDWHCGAKIDSEFNFYDVDTMMERAEELKANVLEIAKKDDVTDLAIEINGDMVNGIIHVSSRVSSEEDVISQSTIVSQVLARMINDMKPYFNDIKVFTTLGNHGRVVSSKNDSVTKENFEMLIPEFLRLRLDSDIKIVDCKGKSFMMYEFGGKSIGLTHGHCGKMGTIVEDFTKIYKKVPDEVHVGHFHNHQEIKSGDTFIVYNGSMCGSDSYATDELMKVSKPSQDFIVFGKYRANYNIELS